MNNVSGCARTGRTAVDGRNQSRTMNGKNAKPTSSSAANVPITGESTRASSALTVTTRGSGKSESESARRKRNESTTSSRGASGPVCPGTGIMCTVTQRYAPFQRYEPGLGANCNDSAGTTAPVHSLDQSVGTDDVEMGASRVRIPKNVHDGTFADCTESTSEGTMCRALRNT